MSARKKLGILHKDTSTESADDNPDITNVQDRRSTKRWVDRWCQGLCVVIATWLCGYERVMISEYYSNIIS